MIDLTAWWIDSFGTNAGWAKLLLSVILLCAFFYTLATYNVREVTRYDQARLRYRFLDCLIAVGVCCLLALALFYGLAHQ